MAAERHLLHELGVGRGGAAAAEQQLVVLFGRPRAEEHHPHLRVLVGDRQAEHLVVEALLNVEVVAEQADVAQTRDRRHGSSSLFEPIAPGLVPPVRSWVTISILQRLPARSSPCRSGRPPASRPPAAAYGHRAEFGPRATCAYHPVREAGIHRPPASAATPPPVVVRAPGSAAARRPAAPPPAALARCPSGRCAPTTSPSRGDRWRSGRGPGRSRTPPPGRCCCRCALLTPPCRCHRAPPLSRTNRPRAVRGGERLCRVQIVPLRANTYTGARGHYQSARQGSRRLASRPTGPVRAVQ